MHSTAALQPLLTLHYNEAVDGKRTYPWKSWAPTILDVLVEGQYLGDSTNIVVTASSSAKGQWLQIRGKTTEFNTTEHLEA